jgi:uridine kinase
MLPQSLVPYIIAIGGRPASGKTSISKYIAAKCTESNISVVVINQDSYYNNKVEYNTGTLGNKCECKQFMDNWDSPDALDWVAMVEDLTAIKAGQSISMRYHNYISDTTHITNTKIDVPKVIIFEGFLALSGRVCGLADLRVFIDCDADVILARKLMRDTSERGRTVQQSISQYMQFTRPSSETYVLPTRANADMIITSNEYASNINNHRGADFIYEFLRQLV